MTTRQTNPAAPPDPARPLPSEGWPDAPSGWAAEARPADVAHRLARWILAAFVITFIASRTLVILIMSRAVPDLYMHVGGNHVHHLNYGIFLLTAVGAYLVFFQPRGGRLHAAAAVYGVGLGLTFDEFGMWLHLGGSYWQRASFDAVVVIAALLGLISVDPELKKFGPGHWRATAALAVIVAVFAGLLAYSVHHAGYRIMPRLQLLEQNSPS